MREEETSIRIRLLGSGTAFHTDGRGSAGILVQPDDCAPFLVDAGPTVVAAAERYAVDYAAIDRLFVTHLHGDHFAGWPFLKLNLAFQVGRKEPFELCGPTGLAESCRQLEELYFGDLLAGPRAPFDVGYREHEIAARRGVEAPGMRYDLFPMDHHPTSLAYRFELEGRALGVSGDTRWCENLETLAGLSDLLFLECTSLVPEEGVAHLSLDEIRRGIDRLAADRIVLVHLTDAVATALAADPIPRVVAGQDGMTLTL